MGLAARGSVVGIFDGEGFVMTHESSMFNSIARTAERNTIMWMGFSIRLTNPPLGLRRELYNFLRDRRVHGPMIVVDISRQSLAGREWW